MSNNVSQFATAGIDSLYWGVNDANGYVKGTTGSVAQNAIAGLGRLLGAQSLGLQIQEPQQVTILGDDGPICSFFFAPNQLPSGQLELGVIDLTMAMKAQGTNVYADGIYDVPVFQPKDFNFASLTLLIASQAQAEESGNAGNPGFAVSVYPKITLVPKGPQGYGSAAETKFTHAIVANRSAVWPWGKAQTAANEGTTESAVWGPVFAENRIMLDTFVLNGTDKTFTLTQTPAADDADHVRIWLNGTELTYTTDFANTGTALTLVAAHTAADIGVVRYEYTK